MKNGCIWCIVAVMGSFCFTSSAVALRMPTNFQDSQGGYYWLQDTASAYGCSSGTVYHPGVDLNKKGTSTDGDKGESLYAVADGEVVYADDSKWVSLIIKINVNRKDYYVVYGHSEINSDSTEVRDYEAAVNKTFARFTSPYVGMQVHEGQVVGLLWDHHTDGAHLHFEVRSTSHPDPKGTDFCGYYGGKTKTQIETMNRDPLVFVSSKSTCNPWEERCLIMSHETVGWYPPVDDCRQATQWFILRDGSDGKYPIGTSTIASCNLIPAACYQ